MLNGRSAGAVVPSHKLRTPFVLTQKSITALSALCALGLICISMSACAPLLSRSEEHYVEELLGLDDNRTKRVVILPFSNTTEREGLGETVRRSFYNHFSSKRYYDFELHEVDSALAALEKENSVSWRELTVQQLGRYFNADFLVYGTVTGFTKAFFAIYAQQALSVSVQMKETGTGKVAWQETLVKRSHQGDVPLSPLAVFATSVKCGFHMQQEETDDLVDRLCRYLVDNIPEPTLRSVSRLPVDLQLASFSEKPRAESFMKQVQQKGFTPRLQEVRLNSRLWHRVLIGPLENSEAATVRKMLSEQYGISPVFIHHSSRVAANE